jgi:hypothetical protein
VVALAIVAGATIAACAPTALPPLPSGILETALPAASPALAASPSTGAATASPSPGSSSDTATALSVLANVRAFGEETSRSFRVTFTGVSRHTTDVLDIKGSLDVDGADAALKATVGFSGGRSRTAYRRVGDADWFRFDSERWKAVKGIPAAEMVDPFAGLREGGTVQYLGEVEGEPGHYLVQTTGMYMHPLLIPARNLTAETVRKTKLALVVTADGLPVRGTWNMDGTGRVSGQLQAVSIDLELSYSRWGKDITITRP